MAEENLSTTDDYSSKEKSYDLFILALSLLSLITIVVMAIPIANPATKEVAFFTDTLICIIFLFDFFRSLIKAPRKLEYLKWGWMDLLGSLPAWPIFRFFRIWRVIRVVRILRRVSISELWYAVKERPAGSSLMLMTLFAIVLLGLSSYFILVAELRHPDANITTAPDAIWWSLVSVTTVGYGDRYPVSQPGRVVAIFLMVGGIGLFSVLTSYLSSAFVGADDDDQENEIKEMRRELAEVKQLLDELRRVILEQKRENH
jgi:voltage-gated potassium channel